MDEVQTGMGRTSKLFGHQHYAVDPHVFTLEKALSGGLPIDALCAKSEVADALQPGEHASTFGGGPLVCAAALAAFSVVIGEKLADAAEEKGRVIMETIKSWTDLSGLIKEVRGVGLLIGVELIPDKLGPQIVEACRQKGLLINCLHEKVLRLVPPLVITREEIKQALDILHGVLLEAGTTR